jgi:hypothetical protein
MADISKLKVGVNTYDIKDPTARNTANNADSNASQAILDSAQAITKIDGAKVIGTYTAGTETLEVSLEIGSVQSNQGGGE